MSGAGVGEQMGSWGMETVPERWWMRWPELAVKEDSKVVGMKVKQKPECGVSVSDFSLCS